jgi:hypothetical protein
MAQVYGAGGKTKPKRGRLGTGSYYPQGTPLFSHHGNVFPGIQVITSDTDSPQIPFGDPQRASISTQQGRLHSASLNPNRGQYNLSTLPLAPPETVSSGVDNTNLTPTLTLKAFQPLQMPHERNGNSASGTHKKGLPYKTTFGASKTMPTDSAFKHNPSAMYKHLAKPKPGSAIEAVKTFATERTVARPNNPLPVSGGLSSGSNRVPPASFVSRGNQFTDPNNSFVAGAQSVATARVGVGRWSMVKKGVV